jgi:hypothetical protein
MAFCINIKSSFGIMLVLMYMYGSKKESNFHCMPESYEIMFLCKNFIIECPLKIQWYFYFNPKES